MEFKILIHLIQVKVRFKQILVKILKNNHYIQQLWQALNKMDDDLVKVAVMRWMQAKDRFVRRTLGEANV